ncbi:hypothetical protein RFI_07796 [Reticulomyxa filosa]|uniref:Uncharacterized protein n=1 Tax=Reticulomyxa filosa TaxID=46433 RepID=X6NSR0_RETFI|nr:hypothetical protein RFI_07796 [Reticulomyxa filosa]|eukprot:ETO29325.1 hypothetical protein RFI_07796 [Reticulomyxa filosa]
MFCCVCFESFWDVVLEDNIKMTGNQGTEIITKITLKGFGGFSCLRDDSVDTLKFLLVKTQHNQNEQNNHNIFYLYALILNSPLICSFCLCSFFFL